MQNQKKDEMVGYVETPQVNLRFSLTAQDLETIKRHMTEKGRAFLTVRSGVAKESKKPYTILSVWNPDQQAETKVTPSSELAF
jgi:hypothetical protein